MTTRARKAVPQLAREPNILLFKRHSVAPKHGIVHPNHKGVTALESAIGGNNDLVQAKIGKHVETLHTHMINLGKWV